MRKVSFEKALKYANKDIVIKSSLLKIYCKNTKRTTKNATVFTIADEIPMPMKKISKAIMDYFGEINYIEIMSTAEIFVVEY